VLGIPKAVSRDDDTILPLLDDVLKARLKTVGVTEHCFALKPSVVGYGFNSPLDWKIYDVGGARHQRQAWAPYFTDGQLISILSYNLT
jgi:guanine nucleotide-binding protein alpha-1 subunit